MSTAYYSENTGRSYPFLTDRTGVLPASADMRTIPNSAVVEFGCTVGLDAGFIEGEHSVWLASVTSGTGTVSFAYRSDAPGLAGFELRFTFATADGKFVTQFSDATVYGDADSDSLSCATNDRWYGFMVCGELDEVYGQSTRTDEGEPGNVCVEPALIENLAKSYVRSINLGNQDRTRASRPSGCTDFTWPFETGGIFVQDRCLSDDVVLFAGFNCNVVRAQNNGFVIEASVGAGAGEPTEEIPLFDGEEPPEGSNLLTGGSECGELIRTINGIHARDFIIEAGIGASIELDTEKHEVAVDMNMSQLSVCGLETDDDDDVDASICPAPECELEE